jgi:hypothetical protein
MNVKQFVEWEFAEKSEVLGGKTIMVPLCPSQIPHGIEPELLLWEAGDQSPELWHGTLIFTTASING